MSDSSQGPGWWEASDDKWYPPELHPDHRARATAARPEPERLEDSGPTTIPPGRDLPTGRTSPLRADAPRWVPWYRRAWVLGGAAAALVAVALVVATAGGDEPEEDRGRAATEGGAAVADEATDDRPDLYPGRPGRSEQDLERAVGDGALLAGYATTVEATRFEQSISELENVGYLVVRARVVNRIDEPQPYNVFDWQLVREDGTVIDPALTTTRNLGSGELEEGEAVEGDVVFEVGGERGDFYVVYKPDLFDPARGVWRATVR